MDKNQFILAPGPTECRQEFLNILSNRICHHRSYEFKEVFDKVRNQIKNIVNLNQEGEVIILTSSGTATMEASVCNFFRKNDEVLVISIGYFGNRFVDICKAYDLHVHVLQYKLGETYDKNEVKNFISSHPDLKGVFITHHETSSGVKNDIAYVGNLIKNMDNCLFIVDSISGLLVHPMDMEKYHVDCVLAGSQKGFLIPPGIAFACLSSKALKLMDRSDLPRFYLDFRKYLKSMEVSETPFTPNISLIFAMEKACHYICNTVGLENYYNHHYEFRSYLESRLKDIGFHTDFAQEENKGNVMVVIKLKEFMSSTMIHREIESMGINIARGMGENAEHLLRVGVIGDITKEHLDKFIIVFKTVIDRLYSEV
ncbi:aspartate aminotransferase [Hathewaya proteolytica DSM 3090]|uniref:Aspartate aminotransferase n=1 Tax=Hathewaya proteolytica DSM 3090 TaxID=1121331 RepID=A0A1M6RPQ5_9CLOT|nr:aminotransferase class V-fold PLP-dependent enzyme [Hathewaya proteolytica]SHK34462.1 aspartate aminotransferase [Hathewaya proteolytica DSM 3090]